MDSEIQDELLRLAATDTVATMDAQFEPAAGTLARLQIGDADWRFLPGELLNLLKELPDAAGSEAIQTAIESNAHFVWHGPAPKGSREASP